MGYSVFPFGNGLIRYMELLRQLLLCQSLFLPGFPDEFSKHDIVHTCSS